MRLMDCLANFGLLPPDFNGLKPWLRKMVNLGGIFDTFGGPMGALGSRLGDFASLDVDEAQQCGGWIFWPIFGC